METRKTEAVREALALLSEGAREPRDVRGLVGRLKAEKEFSYARRILERARRKPMADEGLATWFRQQHALCTYKDTYLPAEQALADALSLLADGEDLATSGDTETLGLAGAIEKRRWELDGRKEHLERALDFYRRGYRDGTTRDMGYTGVNTAFVLDLLAGEETGVEATRRRRDEALHIRRSLVAALPAEIEAAPEDGRKWGMLSLAECLFGLGDYEGALDWLRRPRLDEWEQETVARQLAALTRVAEGAPRNLTDLAATSAWQALEAFLGNQAAGVLSAFVGKIGLGLSGGGFRASLFHIGVLARLAELDLLRHVEVLSCVSGGSVLGAHYYLEVRRLLQRRDKPDAMIERGDYVGIVERVVDDFLAGVQRNLRTRAVADFGKNLEMIRRRSYSRTHRIGELFEEELFARIDDGGGAAPRWLDELLIRPAGEPESFEPKKHNWRRAAKAPILILNATTLNTGHNWQFTATWMGESAASTHREVDGNYRLRRMYYWEAPEAHRRVRLGHAVAASACVPGLFEPIVFEGLYPGKDVRLVDGGVHDNQGVVGLLEQDCSVLFVSDASGQTEAQDHPSHEAMGVLLRANNVLMARVREAEYAELLALRKAGHLRGLAYLHLKKDLPVASVSWGSPGALEGQEVVAGGATTDYGILRSIQRRLGAVRTDLDSFCDAEAYALMTSGYRMAEVEIRRALPGMPEPLAEARPAWKFLRVEEAMQTPARAKRLDRLLAAAREKAFKVWRLSPELRALAAALAVVIGGGFLWASFRWASLPLVTLGAVGTAALGLLGTWIFGKTVMKIVRLRDTLTRVAAAVGMTVVGTALARLHLRWFDPWYLRLGKVDRVVPARREAP